MKPHILLVLILGIIITPGCSKSNLDIEKDTPKCIENKIEGFNKEQTCENGVKVEKYTFQGKTVYVFNTGTCGADMTSQVIDYDCNNLGFLGGISGNTKINGEEFSNAIFKSITWKK